MNKTNDPGWKQARSEIFWGEIAPCDHVLQIYDSDEIFMDALAGFVGAGINSGECCIVIATEVHLRALEKKLSSFGIQVHDLISEKRYMPYDAEETLNAFMVDGWPDEKLFEKTIHELLNRVPEGRKVRAFGEMVAILWANGFSGATVRLEHLWNEFCEKETLGLFCAYPKAGFTKDINQSLLHICGSHSRMISGSERQMINILYKNLDADDPVYLP